MARISVLTPGKKLVIVEKDGTGKIVQHLVVSPRELPGYLYEDENGFVFEKEVKTSVEDKANIYFKGSSQKDARRSVLERLYGESFSSPGSSEFEPVTFINNTGRNFNSTFYFNVDTTIDKILCNRAERIQAAYVKEETQEQQATIE